MKRIRRLRPFVGLLRLISLLGFLGFTTTMFAGEAVIDVTMFGAKADGETDDTASIQKAIDSVGLTGGTVLFPPGTYRVTSVGLKAGVRYLGYGATITRPAGQGKWVRTFDSWKPGYQHSSDKDSAVIHIEGFDFDGNRAEQDKYDQHELEQAHLIFLMADPTKAGRLRVRISNCTFRDCVADAISIYTNVEAQISNSTAIDCFRGGMVLGGGHSRVQMTNFVARGETHPTGIDVEVDGGGFGGDMAVELQMDNVSLPDGDFDVGVLGDSVVPGSKIVAIAPEFAHGIFLSQGGRATIRNPRIAARQALFLGSSDGYFLDAVIDGIDLRGARIDEKLSYAHINTFNTANRLTHRNVELDASRNVLSSDYGLAGNSYFGGRVIYGETVPTEQTHGLLGDLFRVPASKLEESSEWLCTRTGYGSGAEWKQVQRFKGEDQ